MIKNVKIRILAFFMAVTLSFCICSNEYYEVKALEWVAPVVGLDTALKALLGLLGVTASAGLASQIDWSDVRDDAVNYQIQKGNDAVAVSRWWDKVISGGLDTASSCWTSFKEWVQTELLSGSGSGSGSGSLASNTSLIQSVFTDVTSISPSNINEYTSKYAFYSVYNGSSISMCFLDNNFDVTVNNGYILFTSNGTRYYNVNNYPITSTSLTFRYSNVYNVSTDDNYEYYFMGVDSSYIALRDNYHLWGDTSETSDFVGAVSDLGVIGLAPDVATDLPYDGVIDIPWENVGATDTAIDDAFDDAIDKVNTGTWTLDQYWTWVQNITNVFAYDTTNNFLLPNDGDDEKADDKIQQNINRGALVLYGLEKVFPFCIPWDIYAFVNLLVAEPVAPVIEYPIYNPVSGEDEIITIDFSVWESTVILMRYIEDFLLIIGLLLLSRSLIGAGGSD